MTVTSFAEFGLIEALQQTLVAENHITPTPIQAESIPLLLAGRDLLGTAQTGTGKTAAFALPILNKLGSKTQKSLPHSPRVLILSPTRELALQIAKRVSAYGRNLKLRIACVFGGVSQTPQTKVLERGVHILIACPGRLLDLMRQEEVRLDRLDVFVLDEVDRMLDMGFMPFLKQIIAALPEKRQSMFFSATMSPAAEEIANALLKDPARVAVTPEVKTVEAIHQRVMLVEQRNKRALLVSILKSEGVGQVLVFMRKREDAQDLANELRFGGHRATAIHSDKAQATRQHIMEDFRSGKLRVLVATDVAARGLDIPGITHVINYELPQDPEVYVHRIGRTGRAGAAGIALSFCGRRDQNLLLNIERELGHNLEIDTTHPYAIEFERDEAPVRDRPEFTPRRDFQRRETQRGEFPDRPSSGKSQHGGRPSGPPRGDSRKDGPAAGRPPGKRR